MPWCIFSTT